MRQILNGVFVTTLATAVSAAYGDWPASKTYQADTGDPKLVTDEDGAFPGWVISDQDPTWTQTPPGTVGGLPAEQDQTVDGKLKYSTSGSDWTFTPGVGVTTAIKWKVYISSSMMTSSSMPGVQIGNGTWRYQLAFKPKVAGTTSDCSLSGWVEADNTKIDAGGKRIPNDPSKRYLPMTMDAWHTIRFQVSPDGAGGSKFDAWLDEDEGLSDWNHISGTTTKDSGSTYAQWGVLSTVSNTVAFATNFVAWGQDGEVPDLPFTTMELCSNGIDDDGDWKADCADSSCDCSPVPPECGGIANQIFENFNVYFTPDPVMSGRVPPNWERAGYNVPGYSDGDPTVPPGASAHDLAPYSATPGPYYFFDPGPYENAESDPDIKDLVVGQCIADCVALGNPQPYCENACNNIIPIANLIRPTQPLHMNLDLWKVNPECIDKGGTNESCYAGSIIVQRPGKVDDLASLPIDWTQPVTLSVDVGGIDLGTDDGRGGKWETAISYPGYQPQDASQSAIEWGHDSATGNTNYGTPDDYDTITLTLAPGQGAPAGPTTLILAVNFDYTDLDLVNNRRNKICEAFFENVRISYLPDLTKPLILLDKVKLRHDIGVGQAIPDDTFTITNGMSGTTLNYTATDDADWLTLVNGTGTSTGEPDVVTVQYNTAGMTSGDYTGTITVTWPGMDKSPATITVRVHVGPSIDLSTGVLNHTVTIGENVPPATFTVTNVGAGYLEYTISDDAGWLSVSPDTFTPPGLANGESDQITVTYDTASLLVGTYTATITVSDPNLPPASETIDVRVVVTLARPDFDGDNDVDQMDFAMFQACFSGTGFPATAGFCADLADLNGDAYVDSIDNTLFEGCASGPGVPFNHDCLP